MFRGLFVFLWKGLPFHYRIIYIIYYRGTNWRLGDWEQSAVLQNRLQSVAGPCHCGHSVPPSHPTDSLKRTLLLSVTETNGKIMLGLFQNLNFTNPTALPFLVDLQTLPISLCLFHLWALAPGQRTQQPGLRLWYPVLSEIKALAPSGFWLHAKAQTSAPHSVLQPARFSAPCFHLRRRDLLWNLSPQDTRGLSLFLGLILSSLFCESSNWGYAFPGCFPHYRKGTFVINQVHPQKTCEIMTNLMTRKGARKQNVTFPKEI